MHASPSHRRWTLALASLAALLAVNAAPFAASSSLVSATAVGDLLVGVDGRVTGSNLAASLDEATGVIHGFAVRGSSLFDRVAIDGFAQTQKLEGVASPALTLRGSDATLILQDRADGALQIATSAATSVRFDLAHGLDAVPRTAGIVDVQQGSAWLGSLVAVGADGAGHLGDSLSVSGSSVLAAAQDGSQILFLAAPSSSDAQSIARAVVDAAGHGDLASSFVTDLAGNAASSAELQASPGVFQATTRASGGVATLVSSARAAPGILHYDLAYESLPVRSPSDVAVYVDGQLAARAQSAQDVLALARQGVAAYAVVIDDGRTLVLASTTDFLGASEHRVSVQASHALTEAQAHAEQAWGGLTGALALHANGKLTGSFLSGVVGRAGSIVSDYTSIASGTEIFDAIRAEGNVPGAITTLDAQHLRVSGSTLDATLVDDAFGTLLLDAKDAVHASFDLAPGIEAESTLSNLVTLRDAAGHATGYLAVVDGDLGRHAPSALHATAAGDVTADLAKGARVVYRGASDALPSDDAVAQAIANGRVGAQILADSAGSAHAEYAIGALASVAKRGASEIEVEYAAATGSAKAFVLDARGAALAAKSASDVVVLVDGQPAIPVSNAQTALALGSQARAYVESASDGALRVIVNAAKGAGETAHVVIEAKSALHAPDASGLGAFKIFPDGTAIGDFVELHAARSVGAVSHVGSVVDGRDLFDSLAIGDSPFQATGLADGVATLSLENAQGVLQITDAASASARLVAKQPTDAAIELASGVHASAPAGGVVQLVSDDGASLGSLVLVPDTGSLSVVQDQVSARLDAGQQLIWRAAGGARGDLSDAQRLALDRAIAAGHVAGEVLVHTGPAADVTGALEATSLDDVVDVTTSATAAFGEVQVFTSAAKDRVQVTITSATHAGKTLLVSLDPTTVSGLAAGHADVLFDGAPIHQADDLADVLDAADDAGVAEYLVLAGDAGSHVLVSIPHFSAHTVTIQGRGSAAASTPGYLYASVFLALLVVAETALLIRKNRRN